MSKTFLSYSHVSLRGERSGGICLQGKNGERRSGFGIIAEMLNAARVGVSKTHLMYQCNLSFAQATKYLDLVLKTRLVVVENNGPRLHFRTSGKGRAFLESYEGLMDLME